MDETESGENLLQGEIRSSDWAANILKNCGLLDQRC